ncbi:helix-turn-helix transcriptional regulator [bacterium]|nr:helix-turn-helix transcriptional regulator [bacterium]
MQAGKKKEFTNALGKVIKKLHAKSKRSARSLSYEIDISKTTLILAEKGELDPQMTTFCKLAEAFYITPEELLKKVIHELPPNWTILDEP